MALLCVATCKINGSLLTDGSLVAVFMPSPTCDYQTVTIKMWVTKFMPIKYVDYAPNWLSEIRPEILQRANDCCEGSPKYMNCRARNYEPHPDTGSKVVLTIAHLDHDVTNNAPGNLRAWCQRCHLTYDASHHVGTRRRNRNK